MNILRYNFDDIYKLSSQFKTKEKGTIYLMSYLYYRDWQKFFEHNRSKLLDSKRWSNYIFNFQAILDSDISMLQKAVIIKIASYRDFSDYALYGDNLIDLKRVKGIPLNFIKEIPLIEIKNDKINLIFEEN